MAKDTFTQPCGQSTDETTHGRAIVNTIRNLYGEQAVGNDVWVALAWCVGLLVLAYGFAMLVYRRKIS